MTKNPKIKGFTIRLDKDLWRALKKIAMDKEISMNSLIINELEKIKNKAEKRLDQ